VAHNGDGLMCFGVSGETDGVVLVADVGGNFIGYTTDGLALGWALTDAAGRTAMVGPNAIYLENAAAGVFAKDPKTGRHLLIVHSEDIRILEIKGVFGDDIHRIDGKINLEKSEPRPVEATANHVAIPALSWDKSIYEVGRGTNIDGEDYEWSPKTPSVPITDGKSALAEIRLRRDAGNLCIFADVLAPLSMTPNTASDGNTLFAHNDGVELLFGPIASTPRTAAGPGDTRIFLTATRGKDGQLTAHAFACKPASSPVAPSVELSTLDAGGTPYGGGTTAPLDLSSGLVPIPGAMIKVRDRLDGKGYLLEAEVPIALMPEISKVVPISYRRATTTSNEGIFKHAIRSDLSPALFNAAVWRVDTKGIAQRYAWRKDGFAGADPKIMNPSLWGVESDPLSVLLGVAAPSNFIGMRHVRTTFSTFNFGSEPMRKVETAIFGGGWFDDAGLRFLTTPPSAGFTITTGPGVASIDGGARVVQMDMTRLGIENLHSQAQRGVKAGDPVTATIQTGMPPLQPAALHVLWGRFTGNTNGGATLSITDAANGQTIDKSSVPDLTFKLGFNGDFEVRESTFTLGGNGPFQVTVNDTDGPQSSVLSAVWIEPARQTTFSVGDRVSLAAYVGVTPAPVRLVEFFAGSKKIGEANTEPYTIIWQAKQEGDYAMTARVTDNLGDTGTSSIANIHVSPPAVAKATDSLSP
jgi:hypothetical protein